jgi:hypothetical protein
MILTTQSFETYDTYVLAAQENRCAPRTKLRIPATLRPSGGCKFSVRVMDLSVAGFACEAVTSMRPHDICWLTLPGLGALHAEVVWNNGAEIGCAFSSLLNEAVFETVIARHQ